MPMAGAGSRLASLSNLPKPLLPVNGAPMYRQALKSFPQSQKTVFVTLDSIARQMKTNPGEDTVSLPTTPAGQALTTEKGLSRLNTGDCIVTSCDHAIVLDPRKWRSFIAAPDCDAAVFTVSGFPGTRRKPFSFSYVKCENTAAAFPLVSGIGVKQPFTENPAGEALLTGSFWFASMALLQKGLLALKSHGTRHGDELYLDGIFSELIKMNMKVRAIPLDGYVNWGDSESFKEALYWQKIFTGSAE
jgi:NDP-sugar pyrophosphorylase family protein